MRIPPCKSSSIPPLQFLLSPLPSLFHGLPFLKPKSSTECCLYELGCGTIYRSMGGLSGNHIPAEDRLSCLGTRQLLIAPQLKVGLDEPPIHNESFCGPHLAQVFCTRAQLWRNHGTRTLSCLAGNASLGLPLLLALTIFPLSSPKVIPKTWGRRVIWLFHLELSTPQATILHTDPLDPLWVSALTTIY